MPDYFSHARRVTDSTDWAGLAVGGEELVRVELEVLGDLKRPKEMAAQLAMDLTTLRDVECESLLVGPGPFERVSEFVGELASLGLEIPISIRVDARPDALAALARASESS